MCAEIESGKWTVFAVAPGQEMPATSSEFATVVFPASTNEEIA